MLFEDIIIIGLCTVICGGEDFADMEEFGKSRQEYLAKFLELPNGIPDSDTFRRVFEKLNPSELSSCLIFKEDASRAKKDNSPLVLNIMRKIALNLVSQAQYKRIIAPPTKPCRQMLAIKKISLCQKNLKCVSIPAFFFLDKFPF